MADGMPGITKIHRMEPNPKYGRHPGRPLYMTVENQTGYPYMQVPGYKPVGDITKDIQQRRAILNI